MSQQKHIVLLGASVGNAWNIESLPDRLKKNSSDPLAPRSLPLVSFEKYGFEFVGEYQFDKSEALKKILERKANKPDAIFLKECAAYFPGDLSQYQILMRKWVKDCRDSNVIPIPTTVVPVIKPDSIKVQLKEFAKIILGKPTFQKRLEGLLAYNDWVRSFAREEKVSVLDLESTLRYSENDRRLRVELHSGDGLHLSLNAYFLLDQKVIPSLEIAFSNR